MLELPLQHTRLELSDSPGKIYVASILHKVRITSSKNYLKVPKISASLKGRKVYLRVQKRINHG